jgi:hypothetical protein
LGISTLCIVLIVPASMVATSVAPAEDIGVMVHNLGNPCAGIFEYGIGVFNGEGIHLNSERALYNGVAAVLPIEAGKRFDWTRSQEILCGFRPSPRNPFRRQ